AELEPLLLAANAPAQVLAAFQAHAADRKALVFTPTVALAYAIAETFRAAGIAAEALDGTTPLATRRAILQRLHTGATHVVESSTATHCLDACTVIAYLRNEAGAEVLKALIERPTTFLAMHVCNLGEVYY